MVRKEIMRISEIDFNFLQALSALSFLFEGTFLFYLLLFLYFQGHSQQSQTMDNRICCLCTRLNFNLITIYCHLIFTYFPQFSMFETWNPSLLFVLLKLDRNQHFDIITHSFLISYLVHFRKRHINFQTRKLDSITYIYSHSSQRCSYRQCHEFDWFEWLYFLVWADVSLSCLIIG